MRNVSLIKRCMLAFLRLVADFSRGVRLKESGSYFSRPTPTIQALANDSVLALSCCRHTQYRDFHLAVFDYVANSLGVITWAPAYTVQCDSMSASFTASPTDLGEHRTRLASESATTEQLGHVLEHRFLSEQSSRADRQELRRPIRPRIQRIGVAIV
jgi:hypothetical protein